MGSLFDGMVASNSWAISIGSEDGGGGDGDFFLRNRSLHKAVIMAMLAAKPAARNDKYITGCINERFSMGTFLPITFIKMVVIACCVSLPPSLHRIILTIITRTERGCMQSPEKEKNFRNFGMSNTKFWVFNSYL